MTSIYTNPTAALWRSDYAPHLQLIQEFHHKLPDFNQSPLVPLDEMTRYLGVRGVFVKDESSRLGLPAFKILGASWGTHLAICQMAGLPREASLSEVAQAAQSRRIILFAATDGNHGRAVARMAKILGIKAQIIVPGFTSNSIKANIESEGAQVSSITGNYDAAVLEAARLTKVSEGGLHIQDNAFEEYEEIPRFIVEGYSTLLTEVEQELAKQGLKATMIVSPIGVGSLGHAVTAYAKSGDRHIKVLTVEPASASCLYQSLQAGRSTTVETSHTIMDGMCCGTVSPTSWPTLKSGVDMSVTITDEECHRAITYLNGIGVNAGPCGAGALAAILKVSNEAGAAQPFNREAVIVLLSTEGKRPYDIPRNS